MKRIINHITFFIFLALAFTACKESENSFVPSIGTEAFNFKPIAGGAIMHYTLPKDKDIIGLNIRYKDFKGTEILRSGSVFCDSLELAGFNQAQNDVKGEIRLVKTDGEESTPIPVKFSTEDSGPYAFIDHVKVLSGWNGFTIQTDNPSNAKGMAHIFYLGKDPHTGLPDTILINSFNITEGKDTMIFAPKQLAEKNNIVIRTEDYRGYMVREKTWENILSFNTQKLDPKKFDFFCDKSVEAEDEMLGAKYLFDGDTKGSGYFIDQNEDMYRMFLAGPEAQGEPMYIDMHKNEITAQIRLYAMAKVNRLFPYNGTHKRLFHQMYYLDKLPCDVELYAAKDDNGTASNWDSKEWVKVASYKQSPDINPYARWCVNCLFDYSQGWASQLESLKDVNKADSIYMPIDLSCEGQGEGYRYLKIIVNQTFNFVDGDFNYEDNQGLNAAKYYTIQELEVYTKKEEE